MITLTPNACKAVSRFISTATDPVAGLRIVVSGGGCAGLQYNMKLEAEKQDDDNVLVIDGLTVLIDPYSAPLIEGTTIDFVDSLSGSGFKFENPKAAKSCECGQSFAA